MGYLGCVLGVITLSVFAMVLESVNEVIFTVLFIVEFAIRWMTIEVDGISWHEFWKNPLNLLDIVAICPLFLILALHHVVGAHSLIYLRNVRIFRLVRMVTLAKLKEYEGLLRI